MFKSLFQYIINFRFKIKNNSILPITDEELENEEKICGICLGKLCEKKVLVLENCNHEYHIKCLNEWLKVNAICPTCRSCQKNACIVLNNLDIKNNFFRRLSYRNICK